MVDPTSPLVHLRVRSSYSMLRSSLQIGEIIDLCVKHNMPAAAIADDAMFGALEFADSMTKAGIQPIIGCTLPVSIPANIARPLTEGNSTLGDIVLIASSEAGYGNLMELSSRSWERKHSGSDKSGLNFDDLSEASTGVIALSGGKYGLLSHWQEHNAHDEVIRLLQRLESVYKDRLYVELAPFDDRRRINAELRQIATGLSLPCVVASDCHFAKPDDFQATQALWCIGDGRQLGEEPNKNTRQLHPQQYFSSSEEILKQCDGFPEAYNNAADIARRCHFWPEKRSPMLPSAGAALEVNSQLNHEQSNEAENNKLRQLSREGLTERLATADLSGQITKQSYLERLEYELDIITRMNFAGYFLIVADFVGWAKSQDIPVGPGRGSGAASLVAYCLKITNIDPLTYDLLFERFLNPERISMPDFDIDICQDRRDEVIVYVQKKYGVDRVAQIITFGSLQPKAVLRDVGRVMRLPYGQVDRLARMIPFVPAKPPTLQQALDDVPKLAAERDNDPDVSRLIDFGLRLEGLYRHASTHAAGVVIADRPIREIVPLYRDPRSSIPITQFSMNWVEPAGLVKFDFLGLKTLTVIHDTVTALARRGIKIDIEELPHNDPKTFEMVSAAETTGVFQLESGPMRSWLQRLIPSRFGDLIAIVALYRPGPMDNIPMFIERKHGRDKIELLHPSLEPILEDTYGVIIYQEQVIRIAQRLAGFSGGEADLLRRAMGKKKPEEMRKQRQRFIDGAAKNNIDAETATKIFDLVAKFAGYGFNKAHATCYAWIAYQTAWLKANYPAEFNAALMTADMGTTERLAVLTREFRRTGGKVLPPCVNKSEVTFSVENGAVRYALGAIRNVGRATAEAMVNQRIKSGHFNTIGEWVASADNAHFKRRPLEALISAGALDSLDDRRWILHAGVDVLVSENSHLTSDRNSGQARLFTGIDAETSNNSHPSSVDLLLPDAEKWDSNTLTQHEFEALGQYLTGHPLDLWLDRYAALGLTPAADLRDTVEQHGQGSGWVAGIIGSVTNRNSKRGDLIKIIELSDPTAYYEVAMYSEASEGKHDLLQTGVAVALAVAVSPDSSNRWRCNDIQSLISRAEERLRVIRIDVEDQAMLQRVAEWVTPGGKSTVELRLKCSESTTIDLRLPKTRMIDDKAWQSLAIQPLK